MTSYAFRGGMSLGLLVALAALVGCQSEQPRAREQASQRWNQARAQVKVQLAADQFEAGNLGAAAGELAEANRLYPNNPDLVPLQARVWLAEGKIMRAKELLERTHLGGTAQAEIEYLRGVVAQQQEHWDEALSAFRRAGELDDQEVAYVVAAAQAWLQLGQPRAALEFLQSATARFGWTNAYQAALAECCGQLGDHGAAASAWQRAAAAGDAEPSLRERLAVALYRAGRHAEAIPVLTELLAGDQGGSSRLLRLMLAESFLLERQHAAARTQAQMILRHEQGDVLALRLLARCWAAGGELAPALRVARQALAADADDPRTLELVAALAWRTGDDRFAAATAGRLAQLDQQNPVAERILRSVEHGGPASEPD